MNTTLLEFCQYSQGAVAEINTLAGINIRKAIIIQPALALIIIQDNRDNRAIKLALS